MIGFEKQKAEKLTVEQVAQQQLSGTLLNEFMGFLAFLKEEKIRIAWKSINGFKATYKSKGVAGITLGALGWLDKAIETSNFVVIQVSTADVAWDDGHGFDGYLQGQPESVVDLFMEQIKNKCVHCRPTCGCSKVSGRTVHAAGKQYDNVCMNAPSYKFYAAGSSMKNMTICTPCAVYPPVAVGEVPLETVKALVVARKAYIDRPLTTKK